MGFPVPPTNNVLMVALKPLIRYTQAGPLPPVSIGQPFWVVSTQVQGLITGGFAELATESTPVPQAEIALTVNGVPGLAAGVSNASY